MEQLGEDNDSLAKDGPSFSYRIDSDCRGKKRLMEEEGKAFLLPPPSRRQERCGSNDVFLSGFSFHSRARALLPACRLFRCSAFCQRGRYHVALFANIVAGTDVHFAASLQVSAPRLFLVPSAPPLATRSAHHLLTNGQKTTVC